MICSFPSTTCTLGFNILRYWSLEYNKVELYEIFHFLNIFALNYSSLNTENYIVMKRFCPVYLLLSLLINFFCRGGGDIFLYSADQKKPNRERLSEHVLFPFCTHSRSRSVSVLYPFHSRSVSVRYPFYTRSVPVLIPVLYPFCSHSHSGSLLGFFLSVL